MEPCHQAGQGKGDEHDKTCTPSPLHTDAPTNLAVLAASRRSQAVTQAVGFALLCRELQRAKILVHLSCRRRGHNKASRTRGKRQLVQCQGCTDFGTFTYLFFNPSIRISFILNKGLFGTTDDIRTLQQPYRVVLCGLLVCKDPQRVQPAASRAHAPRGCATNRWLERFLAVAQEASRVSPDVHGGRCYSV